MTKESFNIVNLINKNCCFDLQFRQDVRHERTDSPTYYRWKTQFIIATPKEDIKLLNKIKKMFGCGNIYLEKNQARFSVQKIEDINKFILPFFTKNKLKSINKKDFDLWQRAVNIIYSNKGKPISKWKRNELLSLIQIHKSIAKYKNHPRIGKWMEMAKTIAKTS